MNTRMITRSRQLLPALYLNRTRNDTAVDLMVRRFSDSAPPVVQEVSRKVSQYGKLVIDVPWNVQIKPTDPHEYPDMDTLLVKLFLPKNDYLEKNAGFLSVDVKGDRCEITASNREAIECSSDARCLIESPIQYDVDARTTGDSSITISSMVSDLINVETERGNISGGKLQAKKIKIHSSRGGSIDLRQSLQGNIEIKTTGNGSIKAEKCLGTSLGMTTENGDVTLGSNYCEEAAFETVDGNLHLNNLHMSATVNISGNGSLNVSCLDGSLQAKLRGGETKMQLVRLTGNSQIVSDGPVHLIVPRENKVELNLKANEMSLDEGLSGKESRSDDRQLFKTIGEVPLSVETSGTLRVTSATWAESLQLGNFRK